MRIFLIHGMGRTPASMWLLALRLRLLGHEPSLFGYTVTIESLEGIAGRFAEHVNGELGSDARGVGPAADLIEPIEPWAIIGHSLGNIITRLASPRLPPGFSRFIMLAPPNRPPAMARELQDHPLFQVLASDAGQRLCDEEFFDALPAPAVPSLIVAGETGVQGDWHPLGGRPNDAVVGVDETVLDGVPQVVVPGVHTFLMNRPDVFSLVRAFLAEATIEGMVEEGPESARLHNSFTTNSTPGPRR